MKTRQTTQTLAILLTLSAIAAFTPTTAHAEARYLFNTENGIQACLYENSEQTDCRPLSENSAYAQLPWHQDAYGDSDTNDHSGSTAVELTGELDSSLDSPSNYEIVECSSNSTGNYCIFNTPMGHYGCYEDNVTDTFVNCSPATDFSSDYDKGNSLQVSTTQTSSQTTTTPKEKETDLEALEGFWLRIDLGWGGIVNTDRKLDSSGFAMAFDIGYQWTYFSIAAELGFSATADTLDTYEKSGYDYDNEYELDYSFEYKEKDVIDYTTFTALAMVRGQIPFESTIIVPQVGFGLGYGYMKQEHEVSYTESRHFFDPELDYGVEGTLSEEDLGSLSTFVLKFDLGFLIRIRGLMIGVNTSWIPFVKDGGIVNNLVSVTATGSYAF